MTDTITLWTDGVCTDSRGFGGWAYVRTWRGEARGVAGGERQAVTARMELTAVVRALAELEGMPAAAPVTVCSDSALVITGAASLAAWKAAGWVTDTGEPVAHRDLWEKIAGVVLARPVTFTRVTATPSGKEPAGFVAAWSDFAREKCKAAGAFTSPIPKPNLAKFPGLSDA